MFNLMKRIQLLAAVLVVFCGFSFAEDLYLNDGLSYQIDYTLDGSLWIENASVSMYDPARITGFAITGSGAVLDIYGGKIDYMLLVSTSDNGLPEGVVTIYGSDFAVDGVAVPADTPELFLSNKTLTGVYEDGTPFSIVVDCAISGNATYLHYQTLKLGWIVAQPQVVVSHTQYDFQQVDIGAVGWGLVNIANSGNANLTLQSVSMTQSDPAQFGFTPLQVIPVTLEPGMSIDVEVYFAPVLEGYAEAMLLIESNDPAMSNVSVRLGGTGVAVVLTPAQQAEATVEFLEAGLAAGTIQGSGNGSSAGNKAESFAKMIKAARELVDAGYDGYALEALDAIEKKCDGRKSPADFVEGQDVAALHAMITDLMADLNGL